MIKGNEGNVVKIVIAILLVGSISVSNAEEEDYVDSVINLLLNNDGVDTDKPDMELEGDQPIYSDGVWKCGSCDVIDDSKLVYSEINGVDTNDIDEDRPIVVQVGLNLEDDVQCVTVVATSGVSVRREIGACDDGGGVTLAVYNAKHFTVNAYGA